jgi:light-regulated signal transduction histidine kinase (bacteriophytochrome)
MPAKVGIVYLLAGLVWIFCTDRALTWLHLTPDAILKLQTAKGWLFVVGSALLLYLLLRTYQMRNERAIEAERLARDEVRLMNEELERRVVERTRQLEGANRELESFAYAVSHDLRAPLRSLSGFSQILSDTAADRLDDSSRKHLQRIQEACQKMAALIDDLLKLSRLSRSEFNARPTDLSQIALDAAAAVRERNPDRTVDLEIQPNLPAIGDARLLRIALENLFDNAWKYTANAGHPRVEFGREVRGTETIYFVRDNGVGFDMAYASKLFVPFQRLHSEAEFAGTGIGLVTVQRIIARHGGRIWVQAQPEHGATFYFTLSDQPQLATDVRS